MNKDERILKKLEAEISIIEDNDAVIAQAFEQIVTFLRSSQDTQAKVIEQIAVALGQSFTDLEKTSNKQTETSRKELKSYLQSELDVLKSQHFDALGELSLRLSTLKDGKDANEQVIIDAVLAKIPPVIFPEVIPETPDETVQKINQSTQQIKKERVEGLTDALMNIAYAAMQSMPVTTSFFNGLRAKNLVIDGATAYQVDDTVHITGISSSGGGGGITAWSTPPEIPNVIITSFTVTGIPTDVIADGVNFYNGAGYTQVGNQVIFDNPPAQYVRYRTANAWTTPVESPSGAILTFTVGSSAPTDIIADGLEFFNGNGYSFAAGQITFDNPPTQYVRYR